MQLYDYSLKADTKLIVDWIQVYDWLMDKLAWLFKKWIYMIIHVILNMITGNHINMDTLCIFMRLWKINLTQQLMI